MLVQWRKAESTLKRASPNSHEMLKRDVDGTYRAPRAGEIMINSTLANTFETLGREGKKGFYEGRIAKAIIEVILDKGGLMESSDLDQHMKVGSEESQPISLRYHPNGDKTKDYVELWEHPPNGQGLVALMALGIFQQLQVEQRIPAFSGKHHNSTQYLHALIECLKIAFADGFWWITDPDNSPVSATDLLSAEYLRERAKLFDPKKAQNYIHGHPGPSPAHNHSDTVYFCVADKDGNAISFINSNYDGFGSHIIPKGCGFTLQNRGSNFNLGPDNHPNIYAGGKRPYHTIIPGLTTTGQGDNRQLHSVFGVMGGFMQPQGHMQVLLNQMLFGLNPQEALDSPRICINADNAESPEPEEICIEEGIDPTVVAELQKMGHKVRVLREWERFMFGRGQVIRRLWDEAAGKAVFAGGSEMRGDGAAVPV